VVRVVDRRTGCPHAHAPLSMTGRMAAWEATVPLCGLDPRDVRIDVFDALSELPPDTGDGLREARRATALLGGWRQLAAHAQLSRPVDAPVLRDLSSRLRSEDGPLFAGGPTTDELTAVADRPDELRERLAGRLSTGSFPQVGGAGQLLVAELAG